MAKCEEPYKGPKILGTQTSGNGFLRGGIRKVLMEGIAFELLLWAGRILIGRNSEEKKHRNSRPREPQGKGMQVENTGLFRVWAMDHKIKIGEGRPGRGEF